MLTQKQLQAIWYSEEEWKSMNPYLPADQQNIDTITINDDDDDDDDQ